MCLLEPFCVQHLRDHFLSLLARRHNMKDVNEVNIRVTMNEVKREFCVRFLVRAFFLLFRTLVRIV